MKRFAEGTFDPRRLVTMGTDYMSRALRVGGREVVVQLWDTVGQERFHLGSIGHSFYRNANGCLLAYDVTREDSLDEIKLWRDELMSKVPESESFPLVIVGNKVDKRDSPEPTPVQLAVMDWCAENGYGHIETSAKDNVGVEVAMHAITNLSITSMDTESGRLAQEENYALRKSSVVLDDMFKTRSTCSCAII
jgi:small GTP-binding protein